MRIDRSRIRKTNSEVPAECQKLIEKLRSCSKEELLKQLKKIDHWTVGKCELYHWIDILDLCDSILEAAAARVNPKSWQICVDIPENNEYKELVLYILHFTTLLIEHSFSRHLYNSVEHLLTLLTSCDLNIVLNVLNLLYMFSKRSNYITRINPEKRNALLKCLTYLAESWGGEENGFGLADCVREGAKVPSTATTLHYEFYTEDKSVSGTSQASCIHIENVDQLDKLPSEIMDGLIESFNVPKDGRMVLFTHLRLAHSFSDYEKRLKCVQARLQALSVLLYSNADANNLLYPGLLLELVQVLELNSPNFVEIRSAALRTLTSIIHLDRSPHLPKKSGSRLSAIIEATGAHLYHGFLPQLVRSCISSLTNPSLTHRIGERTSEQFPLPLATALFSFLYHLASYETGGEALVSCGMMECLLRVINWPGPELEHITFVTRAVRVIDLITNIEMHSFQTQGGLHSFIARLELEVSICRQDRPFEIVVTYDESVNAMAEGRVPVALPDENAESDEEIVRIAIDRVAVDSDSNPSCSKEQMPDTSPEKAKVPDVSRRATKTCLPQRAALLKSMLNFLKKALQDPVFSENIRNVMDGTLLPNSLRHIISNAEYYGPSLFLLATDVVAVYVFQEPSLLSPLQEIGLTDVVLQALLIKKVPATREVLGSVPNVFSALCLNARGLNTFIRYRPFERLFRVLLSPEYLPAMRRRRGSETIGDTASNLGNAMDELMRHQPSLKSDAIAAIIQLLEELCQLGSDPKYICWKPQKGSTSESPNPTSRVSNEASSSDEEEEDEEEASTSSHPQREDTSVSNTNATNEKTPIALVDYVLHVMKFVDAILSNNSTDDHCKEFVSQNGLKPLLSILGLPNLPVDYPITHTVQAVASVCKSVLSLAHDSSVIKYGLIHCTEVLERLEPLLSRQEHNGTILLEELCKATSMETAFSDPSATPLLHAMSAAYGYVIMFIHVCRSGQVEMRGLTMAQWSSNFGLDVLSKLANLYISLVWESTVLLALCSDDPTNKIDAQDLYPAAIFKTQSEARDTLEDQATETAGTKDNWNMKSKQPFSIPQSVKLKYIKPLLAASSRLGRALAELFGLLVKLCVGIHARARRANQVPNANGPNPRTVLGHAVADALNLLLEKGLNYNHIPNSPIHKFRLTYLICSLGFTQPMLFDDKRYPYHLMLLKFLNNKGLDAFFGTMKWVISFAITNNEFNPDNIPEGTGEFLDAWLLLLEKLANPKAVLETHHIIPNNMVPKCHRLSPLFYLEYIHKMAFETLNVLWGTKPIPNYGPRMTETMITIYRHIIRGEMFYQERKQKEGETTVVTTTEGRSGRAPSGREHRPEVNPTELTQLMDMGFSQEHCYEALILTATLEHATDYLLNNFPHSQPSQSTNLPVPVDEIALPSLEPLSKEEITSFSEGVLNVCLNYVEILPETVFRISELLIVTIRRNGEKFCNKLLNTLAENTKFQIDELLKQIDLITKSSRGLDDNTKMELEEVMLISPCAVRITGYLHILMLIFEEVKVPCAQIMHSTELLNALLWLLSKSTESCGSGPATPKWMAPLLLLIHQLEKVASCVTRKVNMHKVTVPVWRWLDLAAGKWTNYLTGNNRMINEAYFRGDRDVVINNSRRRYRIAFPTMCQINDDSGKARPVMMALIDPKDPQAKSNYDAPWTKYPPWTSPAFNSDDKESDNTESLSDPEFYVDFFHKRGTLQPIDGLKLEDVRMVLSCCMTLLSKPVDADTLHALMQVCVRYTRDYENAGMVAQLGVVQRLLHLTQSSSFTGFVGLATMLIRHILEEPANITAAIERVIRFKTLHNIPPTFKELHYILRECAPAICRDPEIFKTVAKEIMRVDLSVLNKRSEEDDQRLLMKCLPADSQRISGSTREVDPLVKETIIQLLNALVNAHQQELSEAAAQLDDQGSKSPQGAQQENVRSDEFYANPCLNSRNEMEPDVDTFNTSNLPMYIAATFPLSSYLSNNQKKSSSTQQNSQSEKKMHLPLLTISNILKILGDAVRSYGCIAKIITDHKYSTTVMSDNVNEECSAVAFVLDQLMPWKEDQDRQNMSRNLLAALASCNHSPDAQCALVTEVKAALTRTLLWPESTKKHAHIQDLMAVVTTMIENCPPVPISSTPLSAAIKLNQYSVNNMVRFMMRKGIVTDLARIPLCLDLSSPKMPATMNAVLKPLETLSRIMSQPSGTSSTPTKGKPKAGGPSVQTPVSVGNANSEVNQVVQMDHSGISQSGEGGDDDNVDMDAQPELINAMINRVVGSMNDMGGLMQNVIERNRIPNLRMERRRRSRGQNRVISDLTRFGSIFSSSSDLNNFSNNEEMSQESSSDDSDSNPMDEGRHMDDTATDIDDQGEDDDDDDDEEDDDEEEDDDDDDDQEGDGNEGEESNGAYNEDGLGIFEPEEGLFRIPALDRDSGDEFLMIEYTEPEPTAPQPWSRDSFFPFTIYDDGANVEINASSRVPAQHPLLTARQSVDQPSSSSGTRSQRMSRTRRYQYVQMNRAAVASPVFLQRLMTQSATEPPNYLNIPGHPGNTYGEMLTSTFPNTRLIVLENGLGILTNSEEEQINFVDNSGYLVGPSLAATLNNVPTSMYWWNEELRLLDRESICECGTSVAFELVPEFERFRNEEFAERKGKRKKIDEEEDSNKKTSGSNGETEKKKLYDGIMDMFEPTPRPPTRNQPARRIAMLSAAQEVAQATESLAGSIVESVLHPRPPPSGPPQSPPAPQRPSIPEALELIPVGPSDPAALPELSESAGLIPGSVPYTPPSDPDDSFFHVSGSNESLPAAEFSRQSPEPTLPPSIPSNELNQNRQRESDDSALSQEVAANVDVPEGVDPSFLAALPEEMRAEVVSEHLRLQRLQTRVQQSSQSVEDASQQSSVNTEVNPDFLAALPPAIQEEVLAQQRLEQQRLANPNDPVDAAAFFQDMPHSLRQAILTDMEESQMAALPPDLAAEAQNLRREWETRNRQIIQERFLSHVTHSTSALSSILRHTTAPRNIRRPTGPRYTIQNMGPGNRSHWLSTWNLGARLLDGSQSQSGANAGVISRPRGRQVLDYESICCLLVLLFVDDPRINTARLHRVFRNLCYHQPTRDWLIKAVLSIMEKSNEGHEQVGTNESGRRVTRSQSQQSPEHQSASALPSTSTTRSGSSWLNISMDAALGCRATVFHVHKNPGRRNDKSISINPQAAPFVYGHALEILISLARIFPNYFMPGKSSGTATPSPKTTKCPRADNFWDLLVRLDSLSTSKKGKTMVRPSGAPPSTDSENLSLESSPFGQLLKMLASPVVRRSSQLMDKLLRLLSHISISLHVRHQRLWEKVECNPDTINSVSLVISVLISNICSEEGLEDATALLLNLTISLPLARGLVFDKLIEGAYKLGHRVCEDIEQLLKELRQLNSHLNSHQQQQEEVDDEFIENRVTNIKGILNNRFTQDTVVVTAPKNLKAGLDLQLTSMAPLISKTSNQAFFLRILKVIVQLKDAVRNFEKKRQKDAAEEAARSTDQNRTNAETQDESQRQPPSVPVAEEPVPDEVVMDTSHAFCSARPDLNRSPAGVHGVKLEELNLSDQLNLIMLWDTLSECLTELQHTQDSHAVLVLQPAVEAFFLVHANAMENEQTGATSDRVSVSVPSQDLEPNSVLSDHVPSSRNSQSNHNLSDQHPDPPLSQRLSQSQELQEQNAQPSGSGESVHSVRSRWTNSTTSYGDFPPVLSIGDDVSPRNTVFSQDTEENVDESEARAIYYPPMDVQESLSERSAVGSRSLAQESQQNLGLEGLSSTPPPVSPLPSDTEALITIPAYQLLSQGSSAYDSQATVPRQQAMILKFAEKHRTVLNQILRQSSIPLLEGPFKVLVNHTRVLDFDVKRRYFRSELERADEGHRREELAVHVRRSQVFEDSFRELQRRNPEEWKNRFYIVFEGEEGQDAGGLLREWYMIISREIFNPMYALFKTSPGDRVTYMINPASHCNHNHLSYFKFVGRVIAKAIYDNKLLECYFTRSFYKHILGILVKYTDMESEDYTFYKGLEYLMEHPVDSLGYECTFSTEVQEFGVTEIRELVPNGQHVPVTENNKMEYIRLVCQMKMTGNIRKQLNAFLDGFYDIIPKKLISIFNEQELELLISGLPNVDIEDLKANTEYYKYQPNSLQIQWFWRALREFDQAERAKFLQFVTGTSKVPLQGFAALEGMNGTQKFQIHRDERSNDRLPSAHTCFNQLDLPVYETYTKLKSYLLKAIHECSEGFGFA